MPLPASFIVIASSVFGNLLQEGPPAGLPAMRRYEPPAFPLELRASHVLDGHATAAFTLDTEGKIIDVVIIETNHPAFGRSLVEAIQQWRLQPAASSSTPRREVVDVVFRRTGNVETYTHREAARAAFQPGGGDTPGVTTLTWDKLTERPVRLAGAPPSYPPEMKRAGFVGQVTVNYIIDTEGRVRVPVAVTSADPAFAAAAIAAVQQWKFSPPQQEGRAVLVEDTRTFTFGEAK